MRLIQFLDHQKTRKVGRVNGTKIGVLKGAQSLRNLAMQAVEQKQRLSDVIGQQEIETEADFVDILENGTLLTPIDHDDPAHVFVSGTGLTHTGSADTRDAMHAKVSGDQAELSDSMKIFKMGLEGGKPAPGETGVQPEWFWKGDGSILTPSGATIQSPHWADDMGEEPEIAGIYLIGPDRQPYRLGFALANELSDHVMERQNYLFLAHSKLRPCAVGPELLTGELPSDVRGHSRIHRQGKVIWEKPFLSGEDNMTHSIANLEHHHFKYPLFCQPGDIHVHVFGTATLSFADGIRIEDGDVMEIDCPAFGQPLRNPVQTTRHPDPKVTML